MRVEYDREADAIYLWLADSPYAYGEDLDAQRRIDYAQDGTPVGIELLNVSSGVRLDHLPQCDAVEELLKVHVQEIQVLAGSRQ